MADNKGTSETERCETCSPNTRCGRSTAGLVVALYLLILSGCTSSTTPTNSVPTTAGAQPTCDLSASDFLPNFIDAFNAGDITTLGSLLSVSGYKWFAVDGPAGRSMSEGRDTLMAFFRDRHRQGESLTLISSQDNGDGNFQYSLLREADDLPAATYVGKGMLVCEDDSLLALWLMNPL